MNIVRYKFLLLEDDPRDAALAEHCLVNADIEFDLVIVDKRDAFISAFDTQSFDLILADYSLPDFDGLSALSIVRAKYGRLPFIFVSGVLGEEVAVETMRRGATDYVLKTRLERLVPAVQRALTEHEDFLLRQEAERKLRDAETAALVTAERQALLLNLLQQQRTSSSEEALMLAASHRVAEYFGVSRAGFYEILDDGTLKYLWQSSNGRATTQQMLPVTRFDETRLAGYQRGEVSIVCDALSDDSSNESELIAAGLRSFIAVPILRAASWRAGFYVSHSEPKNWSPSDVVFVREVAEVTWDSIERARAVSASEASEQRLRTAANTANLGSWDLDLASGRMICSDQCKKNYGRPLDLEFNYPDLRASIHPDDQAFMAEAVQKAIANHDMYRAEYRNFWPDGSIHWVIAAGRAQYDEAGTPTTMSGFTLDVTERHKAQEALMRSEKLAAVGRLASSIAHEINNPLESVTNLLYIAAGSDNLAEIKTNLALADRELQRVAAITSQTLRFHRQSGGPKTVSGGDLFESVLSIFQRRIENSQISVSVRLKAGRSIRCLDGEIRQVLNNLVSNSLDALQPGGRLAVRSRDGQRFGVKGIWLTVADNGSGIPKTVKDRLFEAFYSTKGINGTGLGLWVSREIIDRHQGFLALRTSENPQDHGTIFSLFLPSDGLAPG